MTRTMKTSIKAALLAVAASAALVACGGGGDGGVAPAPGTGAGTLRVALTDAPNCRVGNDDLDKVYVTVERVRVHQSSDAEPSNGGWTDIAISPARKINLLDLTNGRLEELGTTPIPAGNYTQVRLVLSANQGNQTANSLVRLGETVEIPLRTPSAAQSGLKIIRPFTVQPNTLVDLVIDFDACRSIVALGRGNGGYLLKPILTAHPRIVAAIRRLRRPGDHERHRFGAEERCRRSQYRSGGQRRVRARLPRSCRQPVRRCRHVSGAWQQRRRRSLGQYDELDR